MADMLGAADPARDQVRREHDVAHVPRQPLDRGDDGPPATRSSSPASTTTATSTRGWAPRRDRGLTVRVWEPRLDDCTLDLADLDGLLGPRTQLVAVGWASNAVGTINPVAEIVRRAHAAGAWTYVDAVHAAPHLPIDVGAIGTDFLACSTYKFFGPHVGVLYGRGDVLDALPTYKLKPAHDRFETGTQNFEGLAGVIAAVDYLADVGVSHGGATTGDLVEHGSTRR